MDAEIDIDINVGEIHAIGVPTTGTDGVLLTGRSRLCGYSFREASGAISVATEGSVLAPAALAQIVAETLLPGITWTVQWTVELIGAAAAGDANNFQLKSSGGLLLRSVNPGAAGVYPQPQVDVPVPTFGTLEVDAVGAGTAGVTYVASITLTPSNDRAAVIELQDGNNPLAEMSLGANKGDSVWFGDHGIKVRDQIKLVVVTGLVTGAVYARYDK